MILPTIPEMVFVDLETTGATATRDRITEIGIVHVSARGVERFNQLIYPQARIPDFIARLTGITDEMVSDAPTFEAIAGDLIDRLTGKLFIAHNARFDYGFLKNEFKRCGIDFRARVLCTVKLSRALFPNAPRHNLDALIERHRLIPSGRHRALADADLIFQFWEKLWPLFSADVLQQTIATLTARPALPAQLDPDLPEQIPEGHGVYIFYGENSLPLYVGKSNHLRKRVLSHFASDHARGKEMSLSMQIRRVDWIETAGEIAALLLESSLVKKLLPTHNQRLRRNKELCSWRIAPQLESVPDGTNAVQAELVWARDLNLGAQPDLYGIFRSQRDAVEMLTEIARQESLCKVLLGLEKAAAGASCFGFQLKTCRGGCIGRERLALHHARLLMALSKYRLPAWPHRGPIGLREASVVHVVDAWCYLGSASREDEIHSLLANGRPTFDLDVYKILRKAMRCLPTVAL
jgi:DNA polymerase-3 subunit epsilon